VPHGRLPWYRPGELDDDQRRVYDRVTGGPRAQGPQAFELTDAEGRLEGPFNALLVLPTLGEALQEVGAQLRYASSLPPRAREVAILTAARAQRCSFEWWAHDRVGRQAGLTGDELGHLWAGRAAPSFDEVEVAVHELVTLLVADGEVSDADHARLVGHLGVPTAHELVTLVGYYDLLALSLRFWRTPLPAGERDPFAPAPDGSG
jgi:4-carboxymuconolactone decarboxylase